MSDFAINFFKCPRSPNASLRKATSATMNITILHIITRIFGNVSLSFRELLLNILDLTHGYLLPQKEQLFGLSGELIIAMREYIFGDSNTGGTTAPHLHISTNFFPHLAQ